MNQQAVYDIEIYKDYFLIAFKGLKTGRVSTFEMFEGLDLDRPAIAKILATCELIGFNSNNFDIPILSLAMKPSTTLAMLKAATNDIILHNLRPWQFSTQYQVSLLQLDTVDLIEVAPGMASLKIYGGRMHAPKLQDLPIDPEDSIAPDQRALLRSYCINDLDTTIALFRQLEPQIDLRRKMSVEYDQDLRSKSDAQIAEAVIRSQIASITGQAIGKASVRWDAGYKYQRPSFVRFESQQLQDILAMVEGITFTTGPGGKVEMPDALTAARINIGSSTYKMGIGGLHSTESCVTHVSDDDTVLIDRDVASYYPAIILNCGLYPRHLGKSFLSVYKSLVVERLKAKSRVKVLKDEITSLEKEIANAE